MIVYICRLCLKFHPCNAELGIVSAVHRISLRQPDGFRVYAWDSSSINTLRSIAPIEPRYAGILEI